MARAVTFQAKSANKKFSPIEKVPYDHPRFTTRPVPRAPYCSATYVSIAATCSDEECPFKRGPTGEPGGCFIDAEHFTRKAMGQLDQGASAMSASAVGGETPDTESARMLANAAARWQGRGGGSVWTYTHSWRRIPRETFGRIAVLASCESPGQVASASRRGYAPALVVERFPNGKRPFSAGGVKLIPCPAETLGKTCVECRLCLDADLRKMGAGIAFQVHGNHAEQATRALVPLRSK